jgi:hypothetical protein
MNSGEVTQQPATAKASAVPFFMLLETSDDRTASTRAAGASGLRSRVEPDDDTLNQEKKTQGTKVQTSSITSFETAQLVDVTASLPMADTIALAELQNRKDVGGVLTPTASSTNESPGSQRRDEVQTVQSGQILSSAIQDAATQPPVSTANLPKQPAFDPADQKTIGGDEKVTATSESTLKKAQDQAGSDAPQIQSGGPQSISQNRDTSVAIQLSLALESVVAGPLEFSSDASPGQNLNTLSQSTKLETTPSSNAKNQAKAGAVDPVTGPTSGNQSPQISTQHNQTDSAQLATAPNKTDAIGLPADIAIARDAAYDTSSAVGTSTDAGSSLHRSEYTGALEQNDFDGVDLPGTSGVNAARVIQTMSESEMHVGMHSVDFGDISVRTSVSQQQLVAQITVDHRELGTIISSHIPLAQAKLGSDYGIHASIEVNQSGTSFAGERQNPQQQSQQQVVRSSLSQGGAGEAETIRAPAIPVPARNDVYRLDIRA